MDYQIIKDIIGGLLTLAGLVIAGMGLMTWKKQLKGGREFNAAYDLHYSLLKLREAIRSVRNPVVWPSEQRRAVEFLRNRYPEKTDEEIQQSAREGVYEMRWEDIKSSSTELESRLLAVEVLWGNEIDGLITPIRVKIGELNIALNQYFQPEMRTKDYMELHDIVYDKGGLKDDDKFSKDINKLVEAVNDYLKRKIK